MGNHAGPQRPECEMRIGIRLSAAMLPITVFLLWQGAEHAAATSEACQSLAAIYARTPDQLDAQAKIALQNCLAAEAQGKSGTSQPENPSQQEGDWGQWPEPAPWNAHWPSPNPW